MSSSQNNCKLFYTLINTQRSNPDTETSTLKIHDHVLKDPEDIFNGFATYFEELDKPKADSPNFKEDHRVNVESDTAILEESAQLCTGEASVITGMK